MNDQTQTDGDFLPRILALLFSLALVAERAASRSYPVRCYVLWLRRGEPYAWRCIMRECGYDEGAPMPRSLRTTFMLVILNTPVDAMRIAATYRALARALKRQLRRDARFARRQARWEALSLEAILGQTDTPLPETAPGPKRQTVPRRLHTFLYSSTAEIRWLNAGFP
jgi:hypothetical protein